MCRKKSAILTRRFFLLFPVTDPFLIFPLVTSYFPIFMLHMLVCNFCSDTCFILLSKTWSYGSGQRQLALPGNDARWSVGVLEFWSIGKKCQVPDFYRSDDIEIKIDNHTGVCSLFHYSITPLLQYSNLGWSKQSPFRGNSKPGPLGLDSLLQICEA